MLTIVSNDHPDPRTVWIGRATAGDLGRSLELFAEQAGEFARDFGDDEIDPLRTYDFVSFARDGRMAVMLSAPRLDPACLLGVALARASEEVEGLSEICSVVVHPRFRRAGLGSSLVLALAVQECAEVEEFVGVFSAVLEHNDPFRLALRTVGAPWQSRERFVDDHPVVAEAADTVQCHWRADNPVFSMFCPSMYEAGARMLVGAHAEEGHSLKQEMRLRTGPGFYADDPGFWDQVQLIARGWMPRKSGSPRRLSA
ncbi:MAG TPA: GNAT family N-acetyltransferase [Caulobacteraceae bacterium]|jgi:ribosomal protein S18 acetylase RimI-like enzyme|nr:GNAT family N-acetyltransferase [Caulobacteraceae bacterium]